MNGDILKLDLRELLRTEFAGMRTVVCANLPYYITSPVIMRLLEERLPIDAVTVMVQKEAAARLCASPGEQECGAVSVASTLFFGAGDSVSGRAPGVFIRRRTLIRR